MEVATAFGERPARPLLRRRETRPRQWLHAGAAHHLFNAIKSNRKNGARVRQLEDYVCAIREFPFKIFKGRRLS